jgi:hypothetical protein
MQRALAAISLPESHAHGCHMQKTLFPGSCWVHAGACVLGPLLREGSAGAVWVRGGSLGNVVGAGRLCPTALVGVVDDHPFIVLTETKFSSRCIPVGIGTLLTGLGLKTKHM